VYPFLSLSVTDERLLVVDEAVRALVAQLADGSMASFLGVVPMPPLPAPPLSRAQQTHAVAVLEASPAFARFRYDITKRRPMTDSDFWAVYFAHLGRLRLRVPAPATVTAAVALTQTTTTIAVATAAAATATAATAAAAPDRPFSPEFYIVTAEDTEARPPALPALPAPPEDEWTLVDGVA
jgi:hypothetical protein